MGFRLGHQTVASGIVVFSLLAICVPALASDLTADSTKASDNRASTWALVSEVKLVRGAGGMEIRITADRPLHARSRRLSDPERFVVDLQDAVFAEENRTIDIDNADIKSVRVTPLYQQEGRVTRIIVDLAAPLEVNLFAAGDALILKFGSAATGQENPVAPPSSPIPAASVQLEVEQPASADRAAEPPASAGSGAQPALDASRQSQVPEQRREPAPAAISAQLASNNPLAPVVDVAVEKPAPEPTLAAADNSPSDPLIFGTGVTGRGNDPSLGIDVQHILGPSKKDKKNRPGESNGGESSVPHALRLSGQAIGGYYQADSKNAYVFHDASPVASVHLDASGYLYHPGFLSFSVKPQGSLGRESSEGIFPDGRGVAASTTFLGGSAIPLTLSYSRLNRNLVTFGPLNRLAGLQANTFQDSLGANWTLHLKRLPEIAFVFSKFSDNYEPLADLAPKTTNSGRLGSVVMKEKAMGWNLETRYKLERSSQDLINIFAPSEAPYLFKRKDQEARASADRDFGKWVSMSFVAGATKSQDSVQDRPFDQSYRFFTANSVVRPNKKLILAIHGGVTNNVVGATLERTTSAAVAAADIPSLLVPATARLQMVNTSVSAQYSLSKSVQVNAEALRETTHPQETSLMVTPESTLTSAQAGISWSRRLRFVQLQSHYGANIGSFTYGGAGSSRTSGHRADLGASVGSLHSLELTAGIHGNMQDVTGGTFMRDRSWGTSVSLSHSFGEHWKLQAGYDRARDRYNLLTQQFSSDSNGFNLVLINPRLDLSASHNMRDGLSVQTDPRLQYLSSAQAGMLLGLYPGALMVPTAADWSSASLNLHPVGKFHVRGTWLRSRQQLQGSVNNRYTEWEASAGYQFRSLSFDAGYIFHDQNFGVDIFERNRIFFRAVRDFTIF